MLNHPEYYNLREHLIGFLEGQDHRKPKPAQTADDEPEMPLAGLAMG